MNLFDFFLLFLFFFFIISHAYPHSDGVAPRAKMNQQRSRRFRAAQEAEEARELATKVRQEAAANGQTVPHSLFYSCHSLITSLPLVPLTLIQLPEEKPGNGFDSNCITPGTEFMHKVARTLTQYAVERLASDPGFRDVKVSFKKDVYVYTSIVLCCFM